MNLSSVLVLLQLALSLLTNPNVQSDPQARQQALSFANQAIVIATEAVKQLPAAQSNNTPAQPASPIVQTPSQMPTAPTEPAIANAAPNYPVPTEISIQSNVCNLAATNLKTEYALENLLSNGNTDGRIFMNAYVLDQHGSNYYPSNPPDVMKITTSNGSNDKTLNGSGNTGQCGFHYPYQFYTTERGTFTITYSVLGLTKSVTVTVK